jgi:predicted phosphoadenosine phosphosulfate sulfurtransferase
MRPQIDLDVDVYTLALERAENTLASFDHVWCAFSGGKDSTAVLNVTLQVLRANRERFARHLPLRTVFFDEEAIPIETEQYVRRVAQDPDIQLEWLCLPNKHRNACSRRHPYWWPWAPEARDRWCRELPPEAITTWPGFPIDPPEARLSAPHTNGLLSPPERGNTAILMGIRAQESMTRRRAVTRRAVENYLIHWPEGPGNEGNVWKSYPVYDWTTDDVWTAAGVHGWDYNTAYDRLEAAGLSRSQQRCSPAFGEEPLQKLHTYAACFPEVWDRMVDRVPGVGAAVRYARTELYGYQGLPPKPEGLPWPEFLAQFVDKFGPKERTVIGDRIRDEIQRHYHKTSDPIMVHSAHPTTGMSWEFLLRIAMRGDLKNRRQAGFKVLSDDQGRPLPKYWLNYAAELAEVPNEPAALRELGYPFRRLRTTLTIPDYALEAE